MASRYGRLHIEIVGEDKASSVISGVSGVFQSFLGTLQAFIVHDVINFIGKSLRKMVSDSIGAVAFIQTLTISLETLAAQQLAAGQEVEYFSQTLRGLSDEEIAKIAFLEEKVSDLTNRYQLEEIQLQRMIERRAELIEKYGDESTRVAELDAQIVIQRDLLDDLKFNIDGTWASIAELNSREGELVTTSYKVTEGQLSIDEAATQVQGTVAELMDWLRQLALTSPYSYEAVAGLYQYQLAFGQTTTTAQKTTEALLNFAAAAGLPNTELTRLSYNLAQIGAASKMTALDLRQLAWTRFKISDMAKVFDILNEKFGTVIENHNDFNAALEDGIITTEDFYEAFYDYVETGMGDSADKMGRTITGLKNNIGDLFFFTGADLLTPLLERVTEKTLGLFDSAVELLESGVFEDIGEALADLIFEGDVEGLGDVLATFLPQETVDTIIGSLIIIKDTAAYVWDFMTEKIDKVVKFWNTNIAPKLGEFWKKIQEFWDEYGPDVLGLLDNLFTLLMDIALNAGPPIIEFATILAEQALPPLGEAVRFVNDNWDQFERALLIAVPMLLGIVNPVLGIIAAVGSIAIMFQQYGDEIWGAVDKIKEAVSNALMEFVFFIQRVGGWINEIWDGFVTFGQAVWILISGTWEDIKNAPGIAFEEIKRVLRASWLVIQTKAFEWISSIEKFFSDKWKAVKNFAVTTWERIKKYFRDTWDTIKGWFEEKWQAIVDFFGGVDLLQIGKDIMNSLWDGFKEVWESIKGWFEETVGRIADFFGLGGGGGGEGQGGENQGTNAIGQLQTLTTAMNNVTVSARTMMSTLRAAELLNTGSINSRSSVVSVGGDTITFNVYDEGAARLAFALVEERKARRLNDYMGG